MLRCQSISNKSKIHSLVGETNSHDKPKSQKSIYPRQRRIHQGAASQARVVLRTTNLSLQLSWCLGRALHRNALIFSQKQLVLWLKRLCKETQTMSES